MELRTFGVDTVRVAHDLLEPLPMGDAGYREELAHHWTVNVRTERDEVLGLFESRTGFWQDDENPSIRAQIQNAGRTLVTEYSVPRVLTSSILNTRLATPSETLDVTALVLDRIRQVTPLLGNTEDPRYRRVDLAADIAAGDARSGLISASAQFVVPGARKVTRSVFPGETGRVSTSNITFRGYDKARELENKTSKVMKALDDSERVRVQEELRDHKASGIVRLELALTPKKGALSTEDVMTGNIRWADVVDAGFKGGVITIGGLDHIRRQIDARKMTFECIPVDGPNDEPNKGRVMLPVSGDLHPSTCSSLLAFAVRYALMGEDGMLAEMPRSTFYRHKKRFLEAGLRLDDLCSYTGEMDLNPVINAVRAG